MATRLYLPASGTAPLASLAYDANWELSTSAVRSPTSTTKANTALANTVLTWPDNATAQWVWWQFQSQTMKAGYSWTTADTVSMVIRGLEGNAAVDSHVAYSVRVVSADGTTVRGTVGLYHATSTEFTTSALTRIHDARTNGASNFTSYIGDRIIVEIGLHGATPSVSYTVTMRVGDPSGTADFALTAGLTTDLCPWVELSRTVTFGNAPLVGSISSTEAKASLTGVIFGKQTIDISGHANGESINNQGILKAKGSLIGVVNGVPTTITGTLSQGITKGPLAGVVNAVSTNNSGTLKGSGKLIGSGTGESLNNVGVLHGHISAIGSIVGESVNNIGTLKGKAYLLGIINALSVNNTGTLVAKGRLYGEVKSESTNTSILYAYGSLLGLVQAEATDNAIIGAKGRLYGQVDANSGSSLLITAKGTLLGETRGEGSNSSILVAQSDTALRGKTEAVATVNGVLIGQGVLVGVVEAVSSAGGTLGGRADLEAELITSAELFGTLYGKGTLIGQVDAESLLDGTIYDANAAPQTAVGSIWGTSMVAGKLMKDLEEIEGNSIVTIELNKYSNIDYWV